MSPSTDPSPMMSIHITLTSEQERKLSELARARGKDPAAHVHDVVTAYLDGASQHGAKSFVEILSPIWEGWRQSGITEGDAEDLLVQELREARSERRRSKEKR